MNPTINEQVFTYHRVVFAMIRGSMCVNVMRVEMDVRVVVEVVVVVVVVDGSGCWAVLGGVRWC